MHARGAAPTGPNWLNIDNNPATVDIVAQAGLEPTMYFTSDATPAEYSNTSGCPSLGGWRWTTIPRPFKSPLGLYQRHNTDRIFQYTGTPHIGWLELDNNPATIGFVAAGANLFQLLKDGRIFEFTGTPLSGWRCDHI
jgi:hypothetical protein